MVNKNLLSHRNIEPENSTLYLVGTPIGNLSDISKRALNILNNVCFIACEDTRQTKKLMSYYKISNNLISFNKYNFLKRIIKIIEDLDSGKSIALVSDAGMPGICDPGEELVKRARSLGFNVICIPGPCSAITALVTSGLSSSKFIFEGFLPKKKIDRERLLIEISKNSKTTIIFESPHRIKKLLKELKQYCGGSRRVVVARELTKKFEEHIGLTINELIEFFEYKTPQGEFTILIEGIKFSQEINFDENELRKELNFLVKAGLSLSMASKYLAKKNNISKRTIYNLYQN